MDICCFGKGYCHESYWSFLASFTYLHSSLFLCFKLPWPC